MTPEDKLIERAWKDVTWKQPNKDGIAEVSHEDFIIALDGVLERQRAGCTIAARKKFETLYPEMVAGYLSQIVSPIIEAILTAPPAGEDDNA